MKLDRRTFIEAAGIGVAGMAFLHAATDQLKVGMCDWNLGKECDPDRISEAKKAGLQGIQVSLGTSPDNVALRDPALIRRYKELGKTYGISFPSMAIGMMNDIPLKSEPQAAVFVVDALEAAVALGSKSVLLAFFAKGDLRKAGADGKFVNRSQGRFKSYELDEPGLERVVAALKQLAPRAEEKGVILGLENTLTAEQNLEILDRVGSKWVQVYYDVGNSTEYGYDVPTEIRRLGNERICEIHLKDWDTPVFGSPEGAVDFPAAAKACCEIGYDKWFVLESSGRENRFLEDTRKNVAFADRVFAC